MRCGHNLIHFTHHMMLPNDHLSNDLWLRANTHCVRIRIMVHFINFRLSNALHAMSFASLIIVSMVTMSNQTFMPLSTRQHDQTGKRWWKRKKNSLSTKKSWMRTYEKDQNLLSCDKGVYCTISFGYFFIWRDIVWFVQHMQINVRDARRAPASFFALLHQIYNSRSNKKMPITFVQ